MRFNNYMTSHFKDCRLLHVGVDPHRGREARYFALPGEFSLIGYSDATDSFIIPMSAFVPDSVRKALHALEAGEDVQYVPPPPPRPRRAFGAPVEQSTPSRRRVFHD